MTMCAIMHASDEVTSGNLRAGAAVNDPRVILSEEAEMEEMSESDSPIPPPPPPPPLRRGEEGNEGGRREVERRKREQPRDANVGMIEIVFHGFPFMFHVTIADVEAREELVASYGETYWEVIRECELRLAGSMNVIKHANAVAEGDSEDIDRRWWGGGRGGTSRQRRQQRRRW